MSCPRNIRTKNPNTNQRENYHDESPNDNSHVDLSSFILLDTLLMDSSLSFLASIFYIAIYMPLSQKLKVGDYPTFNFIF